MVEEPFGRCGVEVIASSFQVFTEVKHEVKFSRISTSWCMVSEMIGAWSVEPHAQAHFHVSFAVQFMRLERQMCSS